MNQIYQCDEAIRQDYKAGARLTENESWDLNMFFSPRRIPIGLTDKQVRICVNLYKLRKKQLDRRLKAIEHLHILDRLTRTTGIVFGTSLPNEFYPRGEITEEDFQTGVIKFLLQVHT